VPASLSATIRPSTASPGSTASAGSPGGRRSSSRSRATTPASEEGTSQETSYRFSAVQEVDLPKRYAAAFDQCWRTMRDNWYDERLGNKDWDAVRSKYLALAAQAPDVESFTTVVQLMLGELNGSH